MKAGSTQGWILSREIQFWKNVPVKGLTIYSVTVNTLWTQQKWFQKSEYIWILREGGCSRKTASHFFFQQISTRYLFLKKIHRHAGFRYRAWPQCFQLAYFFSGASLPCNNNKFRIAVICNRLLAYITVIVMLCYVMLIHTHSKAV